MKKWNVLDTDSFSDHNYISFSLELVADCRPPSRNPRKTNWVIFKEEVKTNLAPHKNTPISNVEELDNKVDLLAKVLLVSYEKACPLSGKNRTLRGGLKTSLNLSE